ncbi:uncharacterized protein [Procambarus clarkii]
MLAVKTHKIAFVQVDRQLAILNSSAFFSVDVFIGENLLQELDVTGIDLMEDMSVLLALLPLCPKLTIVKLGGNTTPEVLRAAMNCPITILHISERLAWEPRVTEAVLIDIMIGAGNQSSIRLLESVREGKPITGGLSWPQLSDFSTGYCHVQVNFLLLILVVFTKLQCLASNLVSLHTVLHAFNNLRKEISSIHTLSLKTSTMQSGEGFIDILSCVAPELEELKILAIKNCANITNEVLKLPDSFPSLRVLHMDLQFLHPNEIPTQAFAGIGLQLTVLKLYIDNCYKVRQGDISSLLQLCPLLNDLTLAFKSGMQCDHSILQQIKCFENITSLKYSTSDKKVEPVKCLLNMFPKLQTLVIDGKIQSFDMLVEPLTQLQELRTLKLLRHTYLHVEGLCELPRKTSDGRSWALHASPSFITSPDVTKLQNCGWTFVPQKS